MSTEAEIKARIEAREYKEMLDQQCEDFDEQTRLAFWTIIRDAALEIVPLPVERSRKHPPMSEQQAIFFEQTELPFGKYEGKSVGWVHEHDPEYLDFILSEDEFKSDLRRYVLSSRAQRLTP